MTTSEYIGCITGGEITVPRGSVLTSGVTKDLYPNMCILTFESESPSYLTAIWQYSPTFSAGRPCASNCDFWAARIALGNTLNTGTVKAMLAHAGPHQINIWQSAFSPPRSLDRSSHSRGHRKTARHKGFLASNRSYIRYMLHSAKHLPLAYFG